MLTDIFFAVLALTVAVTSGNNGMPELEHDMTTVEMIAAAGYTPETHVVVTDDGYILYLHRIVGDGPTIFCQHGLEDSSATWLLLGPDKGAPGFRLAQAGYDVWLGNYRGNTYSREHTSLDPAHKDFWRFTWDEMAKYDLPAMLNFTLAHTGKEKIYYMGHSMGTTTYMAMNSMDPYWGDKVELAVLLAPVAYMGHMESPIRLLAPFIGILDWIIDHIGSGEFLPSNWLMDLIGSWCYGTLLQDICENVVFLLCGYDAEQMDEEMLPTIAQHIPAGTSAFVIVHYGQEYNNKKFIGFDWGSPEVNQQHHGSDSPPEYDPTKINTKIALFYGNNDWLAAEEDVDHLALELFTGGSLVERYLNPWDGWNHFDFLFAKDIDQYQNNHLLEILEKYPISN